MTVLLVLAGLGLELVLAGVAGFVFALTGWVGLKVGTFDWDSDDSLSRCLGVNLGEGLEAGVGGMGVDLVAGVGGDLAVGAGVVLAGGVVLGAGVVVATAADADSICSLR